MRLLVVAGPLLGHAFPLVPLARAVQAAGHDVLVATAGQSLAVRAAGLSVHELPGWPGMSRAGLPLMLRPGLLREVLRGTTDTRGVGLIWGTVNARMTPGAVALAERFEPDLVLYEPLAAAGGIAATTLGVPAVLHENTLFDGVELLGATVAHLVPALRRQGLDRLAPPTAVVRITPAAVVPARPGWAVRPVAYGGSGEVPEWLRAAPPDGRPRIVVTRSTVAAPGRDRLMPAVVAAARGLDAEVVLVRPEARLVRRPLPPGIRAVDWVPLPDVLPTCSAVVHHGGAGTTLAAMAAGVPQLLVPGVGDRRYNAGLVEACGAGLARSEAAIDGATLRRLLVDHSMRRSADRVREDIAGRPLPEVLVPRLEALAG